MASTDVARVVPSQTSPAPAKLVKWSDRPFGCVVIVGWVVVAFILQEFCVTRRVDWPAGADGDRRDRAWITIASWRIASVVLAAGTCLGLALVHFTDPGVVPPNTRGVEPDVAEYLATNRPIYVKPANHLPDGSSSDAGHGTRTDDSARFSAAATHRSRRRSRRSTSSCGTRKTGEANPSARSSPPGSSTTKIPRGRVCSTAERRSSTRGA